jgi:hypothetical protein
LGKWNYEGVGVDRGAKLQTAAAGQAIKINIAIKRGEGQ